ncbi:MAG: hypothetical protein LZF60_280026 [Nitrospira sp.]|nr:MAG: hypothetical protein LZF60_280026 [Nitrospira sp.]
MPGCFSSVKVPLNMPDVMVFFDAPARESRRAFRFCGFARVPLAATTVTSDRSAFA